MPYDYIRDRVVTWGEIVRSEEPLNWRRGLDGPGYSLGEHIDKMIREMNERRVRSGRERSRE